MTRFLSSKKYGHERGLSAAFRQWRAVSHCRFMHGYSLEFEFVFGTHQLDENNWVVDFEWGSALGLGDFALGLGSYLDFAVAALEVQFGH